MKTFYWVNNIRIGRKGPINMALFHTTNLVVLIFLLTSCSSVKKTEVQNTHDLNIPIHKVFVDQIENIYILDNANKLTKYNSSLKPQFSYADNTLGKITTVDVSDPLKITIYKKDFGLLIKLDNTLAEIDRINLYEMNFQSVPVVATALDAQTWLYEETRYQLIKINDRGQELLTSVNMVDQGLQNIQPTYIQEKAGKLIIQDPLRGVFLFDNLGQFIQTFPFKNKSNVQFDGTNIIFREEDKIVMYNTRLLEEQSIILDKKMLSPNLQQVILKKSKLYYIYSDGLSIVSYDQI